MRNSPAVIVHSDHPEAALAELRQRHPEFAFSGCDSYAGLPEAVAEAEARIVYTIRFAGSPGYPRQALVDSPTVKWVAVGGSGTDHLRPWDPARVTVTNAAGVAADMMAEYALGMMLAFTLGLPRFGRAQRARQWIDGKVEPIEGKTLLIVGLGKTGQATARRAKALGVATLGVRARPQPTACVDEVHGVADLPGLWPRADFVLCSVPLTEETRGLIGAAAFAAMKPSAVLIDVSRGGIVAEAALLDALSSNRIKGAALDVFATEPLPAGHPLWGLDNVLITPHCSAVYDGWEARSVRLFSDNLSRYCAGRPLANVVDPVRGY